jgi:type IV secretion system protein VirB9
MRLLPFMLLVLAGPAAAQPSPGELPAVDGASSPTAPATARVGVYRLSGARELRPQEISDDGVHTYLRWSAEQELPAVFALNARSEEEMVDGYMRDDVFTIDRINARLVFRIDKRVARAERKVSRR